MSYFLIMLVMGLVMFGMLMALRLVLDLTSSTTVLEVLRISLIYGTIQSTLYFLIHKWNSFMSPKLFLMIACGSCVVIFFSLIILAWYILQKLR